MVTAKVISSLLGSCVVRVVDVRNTRAKSEAGQRLGQPSRKLRVR
jgi:hypothetical protein